MHFTQAQVSKILEDILKKEDGLNTVLKLSLEALMKSEREEFNKANGSYSNGYRSRKASDCLKTLLFINILTVSKLYIFIITN